MSRSLCAYPLNHLKNLSSLCDVCINKYNKKILMMIAALQQAGSSDLVPSRLHYFSSTLQLKDLKLKILIFFFIFAD